MKSTQLYHEQKRIIKAGKILDMLEILEPRVDDRAEKVSIYDTLPYDAPIRLMNTKQSYLDDLNTFKAMQVKLWNYYAVTLERVEL